MDKDALVDIDQQCFPTEYVREHQVFLSFNDDIDALCFREWLAEEWDQFLLYRTEWKYK